jgi:GT2 family glycosyltransferase
VKITFITLDDILHGLQCESSKHRAKAIAPYIDNCHINSSDDFIRTCDVLIYQDRFENNDRFTAGKLSQKGKIIILDVSFPIWNPYYSYNTKIDNFYKMVKIANCIVVPSEEYKIDLLEQFKKTHCPKVEVIETGYCPATYKEVATKYMGLLSKPLPEGQITPIKELEKHYIESYETIIKKEDIPPVESCKVSIIIPVKDALSYLRKCLNSIKKNTQNYELILIDNDCDKRTKAYMSKLNYPELKIIVNKENKGVPYAWNQGIKIAKYGYLCFLNSDTVVTSGWMDKLLNCFKIKHDCGACGPSTSQCGSSQAQKDMEKKRFEVTIKQIEEYAQNLSGSIVRYYGLMGFAFLVSKEVFNRVGVFDHDRFKLGCTEEREFLWRANKLGGYELYWVQNAYVHHYGDITFKHLGMDVYTYNKEERMKWENEKRKATPQFIENTVEIGEVLNLGKGSKDNENNKNNK